MQSVIKMGRKVLFSRLFEGHILDRYDGFIGGDVRLEQVGRWEPNVITENSFPD
jgi:hypothetical protein